MSGDEHVGGLPSASDVKLVFTRGFWTADMIAYVKTEVLLGIIICFAQVPESVAFAFLANVDPPVALHAAWMVGLICSLLGGRPGMVNGATGAFAAIIKTFVDDVDDDSDKKSHIESLFPSVITAGLLMFVVYALNMHRFISMVPATVMIGFCNGLAVVIGMAQLHPFRDEDTHEWVEGEELGWMVLIMVASMVTMEFLPKLPLRIAKVVPSSLCSILVAILLEFVVVRELRGFRGTKTIKDVSEFTKDSAFPQPFFTNDDYDLGELDMPSSLGRILVQGFLLCAVGVIESLMTQEVVNDLTGTVGNPGRTVLAMGLANTVSGVMGGMGGNAMIGLSTINGLNGGTGRLSPTVTALGIMACVMGAYPVLNYIPVAALAGIMLVVVLHTFKWQSIPMVLSAVLPLHVRTRLGLHYKILRVDVVVILAVTVVTIFTNLAYAVLLGIVISALNYSYASGDEVVVQRVVDSDKDAARVVYAVNGPIFFGSRMQFERLFSYADDPENVEIHLLHATIYDYSGLEALNNVSGKYADLDKAVKVKTMCASSSKMYLKSRVLHEHVDYDESGGKDLELPHAGGHASFQHEEFPLSHSHGHGHAHGHPHGHGHAHAHHAQAGPNDRSHDRLMVGNSEEEVAL